MPKIWLYLSIRLGMPEYDPVFVLLAYGRLRRSIAKQCI